MSAVFAYDDDDARSATVAWHVLADAFRLSGVRLVAPDEGGAAARTPPHPIGPIGRADVGPGSPGCTIGAVGEIDPDVAASFGLTLPSGSASPRRIGWLEVDLGLLFDEEVGGPAGPWSPRR